MHGQVVMLIFFSTECPDCQNQFAEIQRLVTEKTPSFKILAISRGESVEATEQFSKKYGITFDVGTDIDLSIYNLYASRYVPRNFLISPAGRVEALTVEYNPDELHAIWNKAETMCK
jgi:peroxiredoxin